MTTYDFDPLAVDTIDQGSTDIAPAFPVIQWHYGDPRARKVGGLDYTGGFFIAADQVASETPFLSTGWAATSWTHSDGSETDGLWKRELALSVIHIRRRWEVYDGSRKTAFSWKGWEEATKVGRPSSRLHVLCLVKGLEELGPLTITLKGMAAMHFEGTNKLAGALTSFHKTVVLAANLISDAANKSAGRPAGKRWQFRAFWLPVGAARDAKGEPLFIEAGSGSSTKHLCLPVALGLPDKPEGIDLNRFYVGNEMLAKVNEIYAEQVEWAKAWDVMASEEAPATAAPEPDARRRADAGPLPPVSDVLEALGI